MLEENFEIFEIFYILTKFSRQLREKFWIYAFVGGSEGGASETSENIKKWVEKSMETCKILKIFINFDRILKGNANLKKSRLVWWNFENL